MRPFIRFQTEVRSPLTGRPLGLYRASVTLRADFELPDYMDDLLEETLGWFNDNLNVPRLDSQRGRPIFWFRTEADECLEKIWNMVAIFNEEGLFVEHRTTLRPGHIIYHDDHQIAAIPDRR